MVGCPLVIVISVKSVVLFIGELTVKAHQFHFHTEEPDKFFHAGHAALLIKMLSADPLRLVAAFLIDAFNFQENTLSRIMGTHQLQDFRTDTGAPLAAVHSQIVQQDMAFTVDGDDQSGKLSLPGEPPHITGTFAVHFYDHGKRLFL